MPSGRGDALQTAAFVVVVGGGVRALGLAGELASVVVLVGRGAVLQQPILVVVARRYRGAAHGRAGAIAGAVVRVVLGGAPVGRDVGQPAGRVVAIREGRRDAEDGLDFLGQAPERVARVADRIR